MKCIVCNRACDKKGYCRFHKKALQNIVKSYPSWKKALGLSWEEYLNEISENSITGEWAKEVVKHLIKSGEK